MSNERPKIFHDLGDAQVVIGVDHVTVASNYDAFHGITPVPGGGVLIHKRVLARLVRWLDAPETRDALALPRVIRITRTGERLPEVENSDGAG